MQISDELFRGRTVIAADGQTIGEVGALFFETSTWIVSLQIKLSKTAAEQLGASRSLLRASTIELPVHKPLPGQLKTLTSQLRDCINGRFE
jgi:hypothetical protein